MILETQDFWILAHVLRAPWVFRALAVIFREQRFWNLALVLRVLGFLDLGSCFQRTKGFWGFGSCFQRTKVFGSSLILSKDQWFRILTHFQNPRIFGSWLMFSEDRGFFGRWLLILEDQRFRIPAHVFRDLGFFYLGSCFQRTKGFLGFGSSF